jgi:hypothetical protein
MLAYNDTAPPFRSFFMEETIELHLPTWQPSLRDDPVFDYLIKYFVFGEDSEV